MMKRIVIIGTSGSGKTMLAKNLSQQLNIPNYDLDEYYWLPHWQKRAPNEFELMVKNVTQKNAWIISGNYSAVREIIWTQADTIIWLNYSFWRCFYQALRRSFRRAFYRVPCCNGNYESLSRTFLSKDSILLWIIKSYPRYQKEYHDLLNKPPYSSKKRIVFNEPKSAQTWLNALLK